MAKRVRFQEMLEDLREGLHAIPEHRQGRNTQYEIEDAGLAAFSVFYLQSPSFLAYQQQMRERQGQDNARSCLGSAALHLHAHTLTPQIPALVMSGLAHAVAVGFRPGPHLALDVIGQHAPWICLGSQVSRPLVFLAHPHEELKVPTRLPGPSVPLSVK